MLLSRIQRISLTNVNLLKFRGHSSESFDPNYLKKIKLTKKLASTVLFGSTLLVALYCRKLRKSKSLQESTLLTKNELYKSNMLLYKYEGYVLPSFVMKQMDELKRFVCRENDIFVVSFPKTGTTWLQEIVHCIMHLDDLDALSKQNIEDRFPYLEFVYPGLTTVEKMPDIRFIKTHLPFSLLPSDLHEKKPKILYIMRNPKDVSVSFYHFLRMFTMSSYVGTFDQFVQDMTGDKVPFGPMWKHYNDIWEHRDDDNILIVFYEDLHKDICSNINKIAKFLGKNLDEEEVLRIAKHCSFREMAENPNVNYEHWDNLGIRHKNEAKFMRKGQVGDWHNYYTTELDDKMNSWINMNMKSEGLNFVYDLPLKSPL